MKLVDPSLKELLLTRLKDSNSKKPLTTSEVSKHNDREQVLKVLEELYEDKLIGHCRVYKNERRDDLWFNVGVNKEVFILSPTIRTK